MKTAIITGASSGMGEEFARQICCRYTHIEEIWLIARRKDKLSELKKSLTASGKKIHVLPLDLTRDECLLAYKEELARRKPDIRLLVNSAGYGKIGKFMEVGYEHNRGMVKLNCQALTDVTFLTVPYMRRGSRIIEMCSSAAFMPQSDFAVYAATKSYVLSLSRALGRELSPQGILVTAVCPGPVKTEFFDVACEDTGKQIKRIKMLAMAKPEKVVKKALLDASKGRELSVYGMIMKLFRIICKIAPHKILLKFIG